MRSTIRAFACIVLVRASLHAQTPSFEVASVKVSNGGPSRIETSGDSLTMQGSLSNIISWAYDLGGVDHLNQLSGPPWLNQERYHIAAKAPGPVPVKELKLMLQTLLAERFKFAFHRETKEFPVYALVVATGGPKFKETASEGESVTRTDPKRPGTGGTSLRTSMAQLANLLAGTCPDPVVDMTGLTGRYDFTLDVTGYPVNVEMPAILSDVLQKQLGLKLEHRRIPLDVVVVDHADRVPIEN